MEKPKNEVESPNMSREEFVEKLVEFNYDLRSCGLKYDLQLVILNDTDQPEVYFGGTDHVMNRQSISVGYLEAGGQRIIKCGESVFPSNANKHPENARIIKRNVSVVYVEPVEGETPTGAVETVTNYFDQIESIFVY